MHRGARRRARRAAVPLGREWHVDADRERASAIDGRRWPPRPAAAGAARRASDRQCRHGARLPRAACRGFAHRRRRRSPRGMTAVEWPARLQRLTRGAAGRGAAARLASSGSMAATTRPAARRWRDGRRAWRDRPLYLVFGMLNDQGRARLPAAAGAPCRRARRCRHRRRGERALRHGGRRRGARCRHRRRATREHRRGD